MDDMDFLDDWSWLPDCSSFHVNFDAARKIWWGRLDTPDGTIKGEHASLLHLLMDLGRRYREKHPKPPSV